MLTFLYALDCSSLGQGGMSLEPWKTKKSFSKKCTRSVLFDWTASTAPRKYIVQDSKHSIARKALQELRFTITASWKTRRGIWLDSQREFYTERFLDTFTQNIGDVRKAHLGTTEELLQIEDCHAQNMWLTPVISSKFFSHGCPCRLYKHKETEVIYPWLLLVGRCLIGANNFWEPKIHKRLI